VGLLDGRTALVTGAGRGIGRGIAKALAKAGAKVVVNDLGTGVDGGGKDSSLAQQVVADIVAAGGVAAVNADSVTDFTRAAAMVQQVVDLWGRMDILVNVAGNLRDRMIFNMTEEEWDAVIAVHLKGTFNTMRAASALMRQQQWGRIVNMSSVSALGAPGQPNYAAGKAGIIGLTWSTANAMGKYGVTANAIMPSGATRMIDTTPLGQQTFEKTGKWPSEMAVGTDRDPDNVAPLVVFLASDAAAGINGQLFHSRGYGWTLLDQPHAVRRLEADRLLSPEELVTLMPKTFGPRLKAPPSIGFGRDYSDKPKEEWTALAEGIRFWQSPWETP
jgi:NAD(P)-dependent dehydrogenase (short-subunit alcohol dehydrogenase family)